jgi:hypothetical protein
MPYAVSSRIGRRAREVLRAVALAAILVPFVTPALADMDPAEFAIPVTRVVRLGDLPASASTATDAELSTAAANFVLADINAKQKKLAHEWGMADYSAEIVAAAPGYFIVKYSYRLIDLPSNLSGAARQYCALLFDRKGQEWQAGACVRQPVDKNSPVLDVNRDGRLELIADPSMVLGDLDKDGIPEILPEGFTNVGDLNGDNSPELMKTVEGSFREIASIRRTLFAWSSSEKEYLPTSVAAQTRTSGGCHYDNIVENISFDMASRPFPNILVKRKYWKSDATCAERTVMERTDRYQWSALFKDYVTLPSILDDREQAAVRRASPPSEELPVQKIVLAQRGEVKELSRSFDLKTAISGFKKNGGFVYFKAEDGEWKSDYAWRPSDGALHFMALNKKTGKTVYSKSHGSNVFKTEPK